MKDYLNKAKAWYLQMWLHYRKPMIMVHIFIALVIIGEIWGALI